MSHAREIVLPRGIGITGDEKQRERQLIDQISHTNLLLNEYMTAAHSNVDGFFWFQDERVVDLAQRTINLLRLLPNVPIEFKGQIVHISDDTNERCAHSTKGPTVGILKEVHASVHPNYYDHSSDGGYLFFKVNLYSEKDILSGWVEANSLDKIQIPIR